MRPLVLRAHIRLLPEYLPRTRALEKSIGVGAGFDGAWYRSQKQHWLGWLKEYDGPGAYGRSDTIQRDGRHIYNRIQCAPMLFWLAEALDVDGERLDLAFRAVTAETAKGAKQCAALRRVLPWQDMEACLARHAHGPLDRLRVRLGF